MTDQRPEGPGESGSPVPRDMPDQQAGMGEDPWEVAPAEAGPEQGDETAGPGESDDRSAGPAESEETAGGDESAPPAGPDSGVATDVPDTDEAGTGRQGAPHSGAVHPEHPVPDESSG
ncbi:hypothetical protein H0H10_13340 [Streptomyces sp. TRM S81-3]|uniref:Uncharacterized protein n=1 Tax=Streptomyces griseicoloratus TaxID=2752516 RepID=A0A926L1G0_9ACTN|nr:hypothetical protein [Streptomyces griseicoloratus]MBD0420140.1 hypothetical protein [Streptomyces griseicoloratus]